MPDKVRHQLFLPKPLSDRLEALAAKPGATKSAILTDAVTAWLNRRGASELEDRFAIRLDRMPQAIGRVDRDTQVILEPLALFIRFALPSQDPPHDNDHAGRSMTATPVVDFGTPAGRHIATRR